MANPDPAFYKNNLQTICRATISTKLLLHLSDFFDTMSPKKKLNEGFMKRLAEQGAVEVGVFVSFYGATCRANTEGAGLLMTS